jgi:hypothetical protein
MPEKLQKQINVLFCLFSRNLAALREWNDLLKIVKEKNFPI